MAARKASSHSQGHHGNLPPLPHTWAGLPPTFQGTSSQAHLLAMSLKNIIKLTFEKINTTYNYNQVSTVNFDKRPILIFQNSAVNNRPQ